MAIDVYVELKYDLGVQADLTEYQATETIKFLEDKGLLDYDTLKEVYLDDVD